MGEQAAWIIRRSLSSVILLGKGSGFPVRKEELVFEDGYPSLPSDGSPKE